MRNFHIPLKRFVNRAPIAPLFVAIVVGGAAESRAGQKVAPKLKVFLHWRAPPGSAGAGCLGEEGFRTRVQRRLGHDVFVGKREAADVNVAVNLRTQEQQRWGAELTMSDARNALLGHRRLEVHGDDCRQLGEMMVLVMAILLDMPPERQTRLRKVARQARDSHRWDPHLDLLGGIDYGTLPKVGAEIALALTLELPWVGPAALEAGLIWPQAEQLGEGAEAEFIAGYGRLSVCPRILSRASLALQACLGMRLAAVRAQAKGLDTNRTDVHLGADVEAGVILSYAVSRHLSLITRAGARLQPARAEYEIRDEGRLRRVFRQPLVGANAALGIRIHLAP